MFTPLRAARLNRQQTLQQVADAVDVDVGHLSRVETGRQMASPELAARLAGYYGYDVTEVQILYPERFLKKRR